MKCISVSCFGNSGGSMVIDLLKEYECVYNDKKYEHIFLSGYMGVIETFRKLENSRGGSADVVIRNFLKYMSAISYMRGGADYFSIDQRRELALITEKYKSGVVALEGLGYNPVGTEIREFLRTDVRFFTIVKTLVRRYIPNKVMDYRRHLKNTTNRNKFDRKYIQKYIKSEQGWYMRKVGRKELCTLTKEFIEGYIRILKPDTSKAYMVLDHFLEFEDINTGNEIMGDDTIKTIVVVRDPRDQYVSCRSQGKKFIPWDVEVYCQNYRNCFEILNEQKPEFYHKVWFDELIEDYNNAVKKIEKFLEIDGAKHHNISPRQIFNPDISAKHNRRYLFPENKVRYAKEIRYIEKELKEYLR